MPIMYDKLEIRMRIYMMNNLEYKVIKIISVISYITRLKIRNSGIEILLKKIIFNEN